MSGLFVRRWGLLSVLQVICIYSLLYTVDMEEAFFPRNNDVFNPTDVFGLLRATRETRQRDQEDAKL